MPKTRLRKGEGGRKKKGKRSVNFQFRPLSPEAVAQILTEAEPPRPLSEKEIERLTTSLNFTLSEYGGRLEDYSEPTLIQLRERVYAIHAALKRLKTVLPKVEERSLRHYLIELGEEYALKRGPHPNLEPHSFLVDLETGAEGVDHYHSDKRLQEMVDCVTQILDWMNNSPTWVETIENWLDRIPHWIYGDYDYVDPMDHIPRARDAHRNPGHTTVWLIGWALPREYERVFGRGTYGVSRSTTTDKYGPGVRFVLAVLRHVGIPTSPETVIKYRSRIGRRSRTA